MPIDIATEIVGIANMLRGRNYNAQWCQEKICDIKNYQEVLVHKHATHYTTCFRKQLSTT